MEHVDPSARSDRELLSAGALTSDAGSSSGAKVATKRSRERDRPPGLSKIENNYWDAFVLADRDGDGCLSRWEWVEALKVTGIVVDEDSRIWESAVWDESGRIDWPEFRDLGKRCEEIAELSARLRSNPKRADRAAALIQTHSRGALIKRRALEDRAWRAQSDLPSGWPPGSEHAAVLIQSHSRRALIQKRSSGEADRDGRIRPRRETTHL